MKHPEFQVGGEGRAWTAIIEWIWFCEDFDDLPLDVLRTVDGAETSVPEVEA